MNDATRYRYLRDNWGAVHASGGFLKLGESLDQAIDRRIVRELVENSRLERIKNLPAEPLNKPRSIGLLRLTDEKGCPLFVDPARVACVHKRATGELTYVVFGDYGVIVKETPEQVAALLGYVE